MTPSQKNRRLALAVAAAALVLTGPAKAEFNLNWTADTAYPVFGNTDDQNGTMITHCTSVGCGQAFNHTPFVYERVNDGADNTYYHLIVGEPDAGFAQEVYIQAGSGITGGGCSGPITCGGDAAQIGNNSVSASGGQGATGFGSEGSGFDPLGSDQGFTGNSTGNPTRVQMRQLLTDGDLTVDFVKDKFLEKPSISNTIDAADMTATFIVNSAGNLLSDSTTVSPVTNTFELTGSNLPPDAQPPGGGAPSSVRFDMSTDSQSSLVTAGQYRFFNTTCQPEPCPPVRVRAAVLSRVTKAPGIRMKTPRSTSTSTPTGAATSTIARPIRGVIRIIGRRSVRPTS